MGREYTQREATAVWNAVAPSWGERYGQLESTIHPCFFSRESGWVKNGHGEKLHFRMDRYFERGAVEDAAWVDGQTPMIAFHHTLEDVVDGLLAAGFVLRRLVEPVPPPEYYEGHPERLDYGRILCFLVVKAEKP